MVQETVGAGVHVLRKGPVGRNIEGGTKGDTSVMLLPARLRDSSTGRYWSTFTSLQSMIMIFSRLPAHARSGLRSTTPVE